MKRLFTVSHTGFDGIEVWLLVRAIDDADEEQSKKLDADIGTAFSYRVPKRPKYDPKREVNYGPFTDEYALSEDAYNAILQKYPDGDVPPGRWLEALSDIGVVNERDAHRFTMKRDI